MFRWWWVALLAIVSFGLYEQGAKRLEKEMGELKNEIDEISSQIHQAKILQEKLKIEVASQNDPAWVERTLIKCLGLVPEGYTKVYFEEEKRCMDSK